MVLCRRVNTIRITVKRASKIVENEPVHTNIMPMENADATAIWQNVLAGLNARRKKVVVACVNRALPYRIADNQFFIHFDSPFLQARTEKDDYRLLIEEVLENVTGHNLRLVCTCGDLKITQMPQVNTTLNNNVDKYMADKPYEVEIAVPEIDSEGTSAEINSYKTHYNNIKIVILAGKSGRMWEQFTFQRYVDKQAGQE